MSKQNQTQDSNEYGKYGLPNECGCVQTLTIRTEIYKVEQIDQNPVKKKKAQLIVTATQMIWRR